MSEKILGTEKITTLFRRYAVPAIIAMVISGIQPIIDGVFLGKIEGTNALASVNLVQPMIHAIIGLGMIVCVGSMSYMGRCLGEGNPQKAQNIFKTGMILIVGMAALLSTVCVIFSHRIALLLGANAILVEGTTSYVRIISIFVPLVGLGFLFGFTSRLIGRPELQMRGAILSVSVNIVLDFLLIKIFHMGLEGAAIATGIAYMAVFVFVTSPLLDRKKTINIHQGRFDKTVIPHMLYNGSSEGVVSLALALSVYILNLAFMENFGETGVAAFTTINYLSQLAIFIMLGISDGISPILSYNYGFQKYDRVKGILKLAAKIDLILGSALFLTVYFFGSQLVSFFVEPNTEVFNMAVAGARFFAIAFFMNGVNIMNSGYFTAIGRAGTSIIISASRGIVFIILGVRVLPIFFGVNGIWLTMPFAELMALMIGGLLLWNSIKELNRKELEQKIAV